MNNSKCWQGCGATIGARGVGLIGISFLFLFPPPVHDIAKGSNLLWALRQFGTDGCPKKRVYTS